MLKSDDLINKVKSYNKFLNPETLSKAYDFALKAHEKQKRDEGSPYIIHPVAVANILTDLKLDRQPLQPDYCTILLRIHKQLTKR